MCRFYVSFFVTQEGAYIRFKMLIKSTQKQRKRISSLRKIVPMSNYLNKSTLMFKKEASGLSSNALSKILYI